MSGDELEAKHDRIRLIVSVHGCATDLHPKAPFTATKSLISYSRRKLKPKALTAARCLKGTLQPPKYVSILESYNQRGSPTTGIWGIFPNRSDTKGSPAWTAAAARRRNWSGPLSRYVRRML